MSEQLPFHMKVYVDTTDYIRDRLPPNWQEINNSRPGHPLGDLEARLLLLPQVGDTVRLTGFGVFVVATRAGGKGRNPQTGEEITIKPSKQPRFRPGKQLKDSLN